MNDKDKEAFFKNYEAPSIQHTEGDVRQRDMFRNAALNYADAVRSGEPAVEKTYFRGMTIAAFRWTIHAIRIERAALPESFASFPPEATAGVSLEDHIVALDGVILLLEGMLGNLEMLYRAKNLPTG